MCIYPIRNWIFRLGLMKLGAHSPIDAKVYFKFPRLVEIGSGVSINRGVEFYPDFFGKNKISIGDNVRIAPNVRFYASGHDLDDPTMNKHVGAAITVGDGAWIGASALILPGVSIGPGAVVAAGSVVVKDVDAQTIVAGNPAKPVRKRKTG
jgi:acetyltransferase-like isoleucine patch superfamily enzyme